MRSVVVLAMLGASAAADPCFEEEPVLVARFGVTRFSDSYGQYPGAAPTGELEFRVRVSPHAAVAGYAAYARFTFVREYYGTYTPFDNELAQLGARLGWYPHPQIGMGVALGADYYRKHDPDLPEEFQAHWGQFVGLFGELTLVRFGPAGLVVGLHGEIGTSWSYGATAGIGWFKW